VKYLLEINESKTTVFIDRTNRFTKDIDGWVGYMSAIPPSINRTYKTGVRKKKNYKTGNMETSMTFRKNEKARNWGVWFRGLWATAVRYGSKSFPYWDEDKNIPLCLATLWFVPDRRYDVDNRLKITQDALQGTLFKKGRVCGPFFA